jgi:acetoacetyl-CoA synthetase
MACGELEDFGASIVGSFGVRYAGDASPVLDEVRMPGATWFPDLELIYAEHVFCARERDPAQVAVRHRPEDGELGEITWGELLRRGHATRRLSR